MIQYQTKFMLDICKKFTKEVWKLYRTKQVREESYYGDFKIFVEEIAKEEFSKDVMVIPIPKKSKIGLPDFVVNDKKGFIVGYIEAKEPKIKLKDELDSEQMGRYKQSPNVILTNFCEYYFFRNGELMRHNTMFDNAELDNTIPPRLTNQSPTPSAVGSVGVEGTKQIFEQFLSFSTKPTKNAEELAEELGVDARILKHIVLEKLDLGNVVLIDTFKVFCSLIKDLNKDRFANLYTQAIVYGLFFAATKDTKNELSIATASSFIPNIIPILPGLFHTLTGPNLPTEISTLLNNTIQILSRTRLTSIIKEFSTTYWTDDPVVHFYETFLRVFDPETQNKRGVFYTPVPVVNYIMQSLHKILKKEFGKNDGLAEDGVAVLDPAAGSMTFFDVAIKICHEEYKNKGRQGIFKKLVEDHIIKDFFAFEILVAPYCIGHFKIFSTLKTFGVDQKNRFKLFLTNTLETDPVPALTLLPELSNENKEANAVKEKCPPLVVCGNPPYERSSMNQTKFISKLMEYYKEPVMKEKNLQPLDNDYLKFLRFAHEKILQNGQGVIGMITSNAYLDGTVTRGVREKMLNDFNLIYIVNLHGSVRAKGKLEGKKNENVFDIQQGVSIVFLIKNGEKNGGKIFYQDLWGTREEKYDFLSKNTVYDPGWTELKPSGPFFMFRPFEEKAEYQNFTPFSEIFNDKKAGVTTGRDEFIVCSERATLEERLQNLVMEEKDEGYMDDDEIRSTYNLKDTEYWNTEKVRTKLRKAGILDEIYKEYHYRLFDFRHTYHSGIVLNRQRGDLVANISENNPAIALTRQSSGNAPYNHVFITNRVADLCLISTSTREGAYLCPLYQDSSGKKSNISEHVLNSLNSALKRKIETDEIFYYVYAILFSTKYRTDYESSLRVAFPNIPFTTNEKVFTELSKLGKELADAHLLQTQLPVTSEYPKGGSDEVSSKFMYDEKGNRVFINDVQHFTNISPEVWRFKIGPNLVLEKWLKEKKGQTLSALHVILMQRIVSVIQKTIDTIPKIDEMLPSVIQDLLSIPEKSDPNQGKMDEHFEDEEEDD